MKSQLGRWARNNLAVLFVIAVVLGAVIKVEAAQYVTMGYDDYRVENQKQDYNFRAMSEASLERAQTSGGSPTVPGAGAACGA